MALRALAVIYPRNQQDAAHFDASSSLQELAAMVKDEAVRVLLNPDFEEVKAGIAEFKPTFLYLCGHTTYDQNKAYGNITGLQFRDGPQSADALAAACAGLETVYLDAASSDSIGAKLQQAGVQNSIVWPENSPVPAVVAAQFSHTLFASLLHMRTSVHEAFALANHVVQAHCTTIIEGQYVPPALPSLFSPLKAQLPDNSSIPNPVLAGVDPSLPLASTIPGWADIRLLAPRAELRLLLTGSASLIDGQKLSYLGEALRALLVLEMRGLQLLSTSQCTRTPANLPPGCSALRCEVRTTSGAQVVAILGGQPSVLSNSTLVEHALRMTLVADSLSLQFRLPPPGLSTPVARTSPVIAGGVPVVDAMVLTSVWAVQVLRSLSQTTAYKPLISLGVAAVGGTATMGVSALDAQRLKIIVSGQGPATNLLAPIPQPGTSFSAMAALDQAAAAAMMPSDLGLLGAGAMGFAM